jgi:hypothetical protein
MTISDNLLFRKCSQINLHLQMLFKGTDTSPAQRLSAPELKQRKQ